MMILSQTRTFLSSQVEVSRAQHYFIALTLGTTTLESLLGHFGEGRFAVIKIG